MERFNQGKACDAVIRRIKAREGCSRRDPCCPENENHAAPVDFSCLIGDRRLHLSTLVSSRLRGLSN